jgi:hypothetical protein
MTAFPADFTRDEPEEQVGGWSDAVSAVLLGISVILWVCFWGAVWFSSLIYVALHHGDEHAAQPRMRFPNRGKA